MRKRIEVSKEKLQWAVDQQNSATAASEVLGMSFMTFKRRCQEYGIYKTNQGGKGAAKPRPKARIPLDKIFSNEHHMSGNRIKRKLLDEGLIENKCEICGLLPMWNDKPLVLQLDHIDGNNANNARNNLRLLCPNCHTQTDTFSRGKWKKNNAQVVER